MKKNKNEKEYYENTSGNRKYDRLKNSKKRKLLRKILIIICFIIIVLMIIIMNLDKIFETKKTYTVINGYVEKISNTTGILLKSEKVVDTDLTKSIIPITEQYKRVAKNGIIATYKDDSYDQYLNRIKELDRTIETLIKDLPNTYSNEISNINKNIASISQEAKNTNSYLKMQEYKNKLDEFSYKKVSLLSEYSPSGSKIRELMEQREEIEKKSLKTSNNIIAPISGIVTYKIDGLEEEINENTIFELDEKKIEVLFNKYSKNSISNYGIKIIDNFSAYFIIKTPLDENKEYIKEGLTYKIKTTEQDEIVYEASLIKCIENQSYSYSIFKVDNEIEKIAECRSIGLEIVWNRTEGLAVLNSAIYHNQDKKYDYVTLVYGGKYVDVPIKISSSDYNISIVENYTEEELKNLGFEEELKLSLYDIIVVK